MFGAFNLGERHDALPEVIDLYEAMTGPFPERPAVSDDGETL